MFIAGFLAWLMEFGWLMPLYLKNRASFPQPLEREEERRCIEAMFAGDEAAARRLVEHNLRLVSHIARKYAQSGIDQDDLVSIGALGLIKAVRTFKPEAGRLTPYASRCIENEMLMALRGNRKHRNTVLLGERLGEDKDGNELELEELLGTDPELVPQAAENAIEARRTTGSARWSYSASASWTATPAPSTRSPKSWASPEATSPESKRRPSKSSDRRWNRDENARPTSQIRRDMV